MALERAARLCDASAAMHCGACGHVNSEDASRCDACGAALDRPAPERLVGTVLSGRYRITGVLGEGGMGVVYEAEQRLGSATRKVAVKMLHPHLSRDPSVVARFDRECGTIAQLEHPNTIRVYDFGKTDDGALFIAMEFVSGESLSRLLERGPLPASRVVKVLEQVTAALHEAHELGVVHRDLKPDNVLLTQRAGQSDFVKVVDFGIAARPQSPAEKKLTVQGMVLGTPPYMSPEQFTGKELDRRSDIYSLGVMAYEMLTGALPFHGNTPWEWATQHLTQPPRPLDIAPAGGALSAGMRAAVMRALAKEPSERQSTTQDFFREFCEKAEASVGAALGAPGPSRTPGFGVKTEVMDGPPPFVAGAAPGFIASAPRGEPALAARPVAVATPGLAATQGPATKAPAAAAPRRSSKPLYVALGVCGVALGAAVVVLASRSLRDGADEPAGGALVVEGNAPAPVDTLEALPTPERPLEAVPVAGGEPSRPPPLRPEPRPSSPGTPPNGAVTPPAHPAPPPPAPPPSGGAGAPGFHVIPGLGGVVLPVGIPGLSGAPKPGTPATSPVGSGTRPGTGTTPTPAQIPDTSGSGGPNPAAVEACRACVASAQVDDFVSAARHFAACTVPGDRTFCRQIARRKAPDAVRAAALNGDCASARARAAGARAMDADSPRLGQALASCP